MELKRNTIVKKLEQASMAQRNLAGEFWDRSGVLPYDYYVYSFEERLEDYKSRAVNENEYTAGSRTKDHLTDFLIDIFDERPIMLFNEVEKKKSIGRTEPLDMQRIAQSLSHKFKMIMHITKKTVPGREIEQYHLLKSPPHGTLTRPRRMLTIEHKRRKDYTAQENEPQWREGYTLRMLDSARWEQLMNRNVLYITTGNRPVTEVMNLLLPKKLVCLEAFEKYSPMK